LNPYNVFIGNKEDCLLKVFELLHVCFREKVINYDLLPETHVTFNVFIGNEEDCLLKFFELLHATKTSTASVHMWSVRG
jgi:hypothetical protein